LHPFAEPLHTIHSCGLGGETSTESFLDGN
jgi:hypothetical protein